MNICWKSRTTMLFYCSVFAARRRPIARKLGIYDNSVRLSLCQNNWTDRAGFWNGDYVELILHEGVWVPSRNNFNPTSGLRCFFRHIAVRVVSYPLRPLGVTNGTERSTLLFTDLTVTVHTETTIVYNNLINCCY